MSPRPLRILAADYLALRRGLGFKLARHEQILQQFARFAEHSGHRGPVTTDLVLRWATTSAGSSGSARVRLSVLRGFAQYCAAFDPATEILPAGSLGRAPSRRPPHIYSEAEITDLLLAAAEIRPHEGLRPRTYVTLFALLASTGLRIGEARRLSRRDVDLDARVVTVREGKFRKSRMVPLHPTALEPLKRYAAYRDGRRGVPRSEAFFRTEYASDLTPMAATMTFRKLRARLGWTTEGRTHRPRIHDLRHTFAVRRLVQWHAEGAEIHRKIPTLATYLGHAKVSDTYWYLSAVPELMILTARRFEHFACRQPESAL